MHDKLFNMARSKLHIQPGARDTVSLHRWVLLKNSIILSTPQTPVSSPIDDDTDDTEELDSDTFMFPDAGKFVSGSTTNVGTSEAQWLDSLLQTLGGDEDDEDESNISIHVEEDEEDNDNDNDDQLSPVGSPVSSSDDLLNHAACFPHPISVPYLYPYPVPYPPVHPPLIYPYELDPESSFDSSFSSPLPYYDTENLSVPDAIEDTSDDESSDTLTTPSLGRSSNSIALLDSPPPERSRLRYAQPHVHLEPDNPYFYPFELDPLPFPNDQQPYNTYQEHVRIIEGPMHINFWSHPPTTPEIMYKKPGGITLYHTLSNHDSGKPNSSVPISPPMT
ncbi:hypothetical protein H0H93_007248 [Arthromyces matolae]|nr:hypothetical protein H0H93_007248 [Arthromyces matolae]